MKRIYSDLQNHLYTAMNELYRKAKIRQQLWMRKIAKRELSFSADDYKNDLRIKYQLRIEFSGPSFIIRWFRYDFYRNGGKLVRVVKSVPSPKNGKYTKGHFKDASEWELDVILRLEFALSKIRAQTKILMDCHRAFLCAIKIENVDIPVKNLCFRVSPNPASIKTYKEKYR